MVFLILYIPFGMIPVVGLGVGGRVGFAVGAGVGLRVGGSVGLGVGAGVGLGVGVGGGVGTGVGFRVGAGVAAPVVVVVVVVVVEGLRLGGSGNTPEFHRGSSLKVSMSQYWTLLVSILIWAFFASRSLWFTDYHYKVSNQTVHTLLALHSKLKR